MGLASSPGGLTLVEREIEGELCLYSIRISRIAHRFQLFYCHSLPYN